MRDGRDPALVLGDPERRWPPGRLLAHPDAAAGRTWRVSRGWLPLPRPLVMGIVNVTPDSFSDGGRHAQVDDAVAHCQRLVEEGADILDIGGESTRPGARPVPPQEEAARVLPVLRQALQLGVAVSVDTSAVEVIGPALELGVDIINDVRSLQRPGALELVAAHSNVGVCLMHSRGEPDTMQRQAQYGDVVAEVIRWLAARSAAVQAAGVSPDRIAWDPGIGFAKDAGHNLQLLRRQAELREAGFPVLVGWSRKGTLGLITGREPTQRVAASVAAALASVQRGADVVRVHDVAPTVDALKVWRLADAMA